MNPISNSAPTADEAMQRLKAGNERFIAGTARFPTVQKKILADLANGQHPYATILSCSDSGVPPELIYPAADLSEQISTAGKEASGTGNMKFSLNGALTIGTLDGANVKIREEVGPENFFLFGLTAAEVAEVKSRGYRPRDHYEQNAALREVMDFIASGALGRGDVELFRPIVENLLNHDPFLVLADYQAYIDAQERVSALWSDPHAWTRQSILNCAHGQIFLRPLDPRVLRARMEGSARVRGRIAGARLSEMDRQCSRSFSSRGA